MTRAAAARPPAWIATEYNNQGSPSTFYSIGAESPGVPGPDGNTGTNQTAGTFGNTSSTSYSEPGPDRMIGSVFTSPGDVGSVTSVTFHGRGVSAGVNVKAVIVKHSDMTIVPNGVSSSSLVSTVEADYTLTFPTAVALSPNTEYVLLVIADGALRFWFVAGDANQGHYDPCNRYASPANPASAQHNNNRYDIYATYTKAAQR